ncbi:hypothetical protein C7271_12110 [filamentous cyanobacterium CCP5]|nr:hypothetical protein C7271_12110 [filamentous cyanobacterium CCP5]
MRKMETNIAEYLKSLPKHEPVYYFPNPGNGGDSLIACATFQMLDELGLKYKLFLPSKHDPAGKTLICYPGGNFISRYPNTRNFLNQYHEIAKKIIIFPSTIYGHEDLLAQLGSNIDIFTREKVSHDFVRKNAPRVNLFLSDDMAFFLDVQKALRQIPVLFSSFTTMTIPSRRIQKGNLFEFQYFLENLNGDKDGKILNAFRTDQEKTNIEIPSGNLDIAEKFSYGTTKRRATYAAYRLLKFLNQYDEIRTSRLHTCIAGALLGKKVEFYPNNYFKCEAVYKFSIQDRFPNVKWMG